MKLTRTKLKQLIQEVISEITPDPTTDIPENWESPISGGGGYMLERGGVSFIERFYVGGTPNRPQWGALDHAKILERGEAEGLSRTILAVEGEDTRLVEKSEYEGL